MPPSPRGMSATGPQRELSMKDLRTAEHETSCVFQADVLMGKRFVHGKLWYNHLWETVYPWQTTVERVSLGVSHQKLGRPLTLIHMNQNGNVENASKLGQKWK